MDVDIRNSVSNFPKVFYHGTDLRYIGLSKENRDQLHSYCYGLRELLYARFSAYYDINDHEYTRLKELLGSLVEDEPKIFENLKRGLCDILLSKMSEDFEYGSLYLTSNIISAHLYAIKSYAGGEFASSAYALTKAAKAIGHEDWYKVENLPELSLFADLLIKFAEETPKPVIFKITDVDPTFLRTEQNERIEAYIRNGRLYHTEFRYNKEIDLSKYDYYIVDKDFKKRARAGEFDEI